MSRMIARRLVPSPAMVVAATALIIAIGGTSYAVTRLPARSVGGVNLKNNAVTSAKVANDSLTGADIKESTLQGVPSGALSGVEIKTATALVPPAASLDTPGVASASALCPEGFQAIAGGAKLEVPETGEIADSFPDAGGSVWTVHVANGDTTSAHGFTAYAICVRRGSSDG
jgi:hypothetical protein